MRRGWLVAGAVLVLAGVVVWVLVSWPRELPEPVRADYRSEFVGDREGYRFWPISAPVEMDVAYRFDAGHCGLDHLTDFDGSFWDPVNPNHPSEEPLFFYNQDVGTIELVGPDEARYRSSSGDEVTLLRIAGPVVTQPCA